MQLTIVRSSRFKKSYKRASQLQGFKREVFIQIVDCLSKGIALDVKYRDHALRGNFVGSRECHIAPDILLVYAIDEGILTLTLINIGNHAQLFR
jgi:mRNA interferase YafQ